MTDQCSSRFDFLVKERIIFSVQTCCLLEGLFLTEGLFQESTQHHYSTTVHKGNFKKPVGSCYKTFGINPSKIIQFRAEGQDKIQILSILAILMIQVIGLWKSIHANLSLSLTSSLNQFLLEQQEIWLIKHIHLWIKWKFWTEKSRKFCQLIKLK